MTMTAPVMAELTTEEIDLLNDVREHRIGLSRGRYFRIETGQPSADGHLLQVLRAKKLVVLAQAPANRIPPTRLCKLTDAGKAALGVA